MHGSLSETSVADLCRQFADAGATGTLEVEHPAGTGRLAFVNGRLVWAEPPTAQARLGDRLVHAGLLSRDGLDAALTDQAESDEPTRLGAVLVERGLVARDTIRVFVQEQILDALVELSLRSEGTYTFTSDDGLGEDLPADLLVGDALAVVARRQEEWAHLRQAIPGPDAIPRISGPAAVDTQHLEPDDLAVLGVVDGRHSIRQLAVRLGYGTYEAARVVYGLVLQGVVELQPAAPSPPRPEVDLDDEEFAQLIEDLAQEATASSGRPRAPSPQGPPAREQAPEPTAEAEAEAEAGPAPDADPEPATDAEPQPEPSPEPTRNRGSDISEFLRELSRLAVEDPRDRDR